MLLRGHEPLRYILLGPHLDWDRTVVGAANLAHGLFRNVSCNAGELSLMGAMKLYLFSHKPSESLDVDHLETCVDEIVQMIDDNFGA